MDRSRSPHPMHLRASPDPSERADRRTAGRGARRLAGLLLLSASTACVTAPAASRRLPRLDRTVLTEQQIRDGHYTNAYAAVEALRSNWLRPHGPDGFVSATPVWVYVNANRLGGVESLQGVMAQSVVYIRFYDGLAATARWGIGHGMGVIFVSTLPGNATKIMPFQ